jgi:FtsP/CotA-like multicopper oxidase with cupredoxin domain
MTDRRVTRRQAIGYGGAITAGAMGGWVAARGRSGGSARPAAGPRELPQPPLRRSRDGTLNVRLTCQNAVVDVGAPKLIHTMTYNGEIPGYTWELQPGDDLNVDLINNLPRLRPMPVVRMDRPHEWTTTNLHTHGLHVPPDGKSDNVFLTIEPGHREMLHVPLPASHTGGMFWYHPHRHGGVTQAIRAGMAGTIIVRGAIDQVPEVKAAAEKIMVLQAIELGTDYKLLPPNPEPGEGESFFPRDRVLYTVNGVLNPKVTMYPGEVQRWRLLNAAQGNFMSLTLKQHEFHVLAWDGLTLKQAETTDVVMLSAGNRVELLVRATKPGRYDLVLTPGSAQMPDIPGMPEAGPGERGQVDRPMVMPGLTMAEGELDRRTILTVEVTGHGPTMGLPTGLPAYDEPMLPFARHRDFAFTIQEPGGKFLNFGIDGQGYNPGIKPYQPLLGTSEEWHLRNSFNPAMGTEAHVFHIHTNPFKIIKRNGKKLDTPLWRDTYVLTKRSGDSLTFLSNFADFTGKYVEHCHVVTHEDLGMMSEIEVVRHRPR